MPGLVFGQAVKNHNIHIQAPVRLRYNFNDPPLAQSTCAAHCGGLMGYSEPILHC